MYTYRLILHILQIRPIFFTAFKGILLYFKKQYVRVCVWLDYFALAWQKKIFLRILIIRRMTFEFEYLGEFEFIFENNLGYESWHQEGAFDGEIETEVGNLVQVQH